MIWLLSLASAVLVYVVEPVVQTLVFGQLGVFLVALVILDLGTVIPWRPNMVDLGVYRRTGSVLVVARGVSICLLPVVVA